EHATFAIVDDASHVSQGVDRVGEAALPVVDEAGDMALRVGPANDVAIPVVFIARREIELTDAGVNDLARASAQGVVDVFRDTRVCASNALGHQQHHPALVVLIFGA